MNKYIQLLIGLLFWASVFILSIGLVIKLVHMLH